MSITSRACSTSFEPGHRQMGHTPPLLGIGCQFSKSSALRGGLWLLRWVGHYRCAIYGSSIGLVWFQHGKPVWALIAFVHPLLRLQKLADRAAPLRLGIGLRAPTGPLLHSVSYVCSIISAWLNAQLQETATALQAVGRTALHARPAMGVLHTRRLGRTRPTPQRPRLYVGAGAWQAVAGAGDVVSPARLGSPAGRLPRIRSSRCAI
jgi:hypothetical protein